MLCDNKGGKCMTKRVVYQATCKACSKSSNGMEEGENVGYSYIGETSRQVGNKGERAH